MKGTFVPGGPVVKDMLTNAGNTGSLPGTEDATCSGATKTRTTIEVLACSRPQVLQPEKVLQ